MKWPAEDIWAAVAPSLPDFTVEILPSLASTNTELMLRARQGQLVPVLLVAEHQTAGRGRLGRDWYSQAGDCLTFSLGLPLAPPVWSGLSLAVGVSVGESLHAQIGLKWPNDLWLSGPTGDRKLGGILIETASVGGVRYAVIGVGINIAAPAFAAHPSSPLGYSIPPAGLRELLTGVEAGEVLRQIAAPLIETLRGFELAGFAPFQSRFNARDVLRDRPVAVSDGHGGVIEGTAHGVGEDGALLVHTALGMKQITSSEVSVRPALPRPA